MYLTCEQCETKYKLADVKLGHDGHLVRCTSCGHVWFAPPPFDTHAQSHAFEEERRLDELQTEFPKHTVDEDLLKQIGFEDAVDEAQEETAQVEELSEPPVGATPIPEVVKPPKTRSYDIPVIEYRPMGMRAGQFGVCVFLLLVFVTLGPMLATKGTIVRTLPAMNSFYSLMGINVKAPGEGLRLAELKALHAIDHKGQKIKMSARLANISDHDLVYPPLRASVKGPYGAELAHWEIKTDLGRAIASGQSVPIEAVFDDPPEHATLLRLEVVEE